MVKNRKPEQNLRPLETFDDSAKKLRQIFMNLASDIAESKPPVLRIPVRTASNTVYDENRKILTLGERVSERRFNDISEVRSFMQTLLLARGIYEPSSTTITRP